jgi:hypothetical protein
MSFEYLSANYNAISKTPYLTDLRIDQKGENRKILALRWYTKIPFVGRVVSYIRYRICNPHVIQRELAEINQLQNDKFKEEVSAFLNEDKANETDLERIYRYSSCLNKFFLQCSRLSPSISNEPTIEWLTIRKRIDLTSAQHCLEKGDNNNVNLIQTIKFKKLIDKISPLSNLVIPRIYKIVNKYELLQRIELEINKPIKSLINEAEKCIQELSKFNSLKQFQKLKSDEFARLRKPLEVIKENPQFELAFPEIYQKINHLCTQLTPDFSKVPEDVLNQHFAKFSSNLFKKLYEFVDTVPESKAFIAKKLVQYFTEKAKSHTQQMHQYSSKKLDEENNNLIEIMKFKKLIDKISLSSDLISPEISTLFNNYDLLHRMELGINMTIKSLINKAEDCIQEVSLFNSVKQFQKLKSGFARQKELLRESLKLMKDNQFELAFPGIYQEINRLCMQLNPNFSEIPENQLDGYFANFSKVPKSMLDDQFVEFSTSQLFKKLCKFVDSFPESKSFIAKKLVEHFNKQAEHCSLQVHQYIDKVEKVDVKNLLKDHTYLLTVANKVNKFAGEATLSVSIGSNIEVSKIIEEVEQELEHVGQRPIDLLKFKKIRRVAYLNKAGVFVEPQNEVSEKITYLLKKHKFLKAHQDGISQIMESKKFFEKKIKDLASLEELERFKKLLCNEEQSKINGKYFFGGPYSSKFKNHFPELFAKLEKDFNLLEEQFERMANLNNLSEEAQQRYLDEFSAEGLFELAKKMPKSEKAIEKALARRVPKIFREMVASLNQQAKEYSLEHKLDSTALTEKLTQMEEDSKTQAVPCSLEAAMNYLLHQREALIFALAIAPPNLIESLKLPCTDYLTGMKSSERRFNLESSCGCLIHDGLKKAYFWSQFHSIKREFLKRTEFSKTIAFSKPTKLPQKTEFPKRFFDEAFKLLLDQQILQAVELILWHPIETFEQQKSVQKAIKKVMDKTSVKGIPFESLPEGLKSDLIQLSLRVADNISKENIQAEDNLAVYAKELVPFKKEGWVSLEIEFNHLTKKPQTISESKKEKLLEAAGWIIRNAYFEVKHLTLYEAAQKFYYLHSHLHMDDLPDKLIDHNFKLSEGKSNVNLSDELFYERLQWRLVSKRWDQIIQARMCLKLPQRIDKFFNEVLTHFDDKDENKKKLKEEISQFKLGVKPLNTIQASKEFAASTLKPFMEKVFLQNIKIKRAFTFSSLPCSIKLLIKSSSESGRSIKCRKNRCEVHSAMNNSEFLNKCNEFIKNPTDTYFYGMTLITALERLATIDVKQAQKMAMVIYNDGEINPRELDDEIERDNLTPSELIDFQDLYECILKSPMFEEIKMYLCYEDSFLKMFTILYCKYEKRFSTEKLNELIWMIIDPAIKQKTLSDVAVIYREQARQLRKASSEITGVLHPQTQIQRQTKRQKKVKKASSTH